MDSLFQLALVMVVGCIALGVGAAPAAADPEVNNTSIRHVSGPQPNMSNVSFDVEFSSGMAQIDVSKNASGNFTTDLGNLENLTYNTTFRLNVTFNDYQPRFLIAGSNTTEWTVVNVSSNTTRASWTVQPIQFASLTNATGPDNEWPSGNNTADTQTNYTIGGAIGNFSFMNDEYISYMDGMLVSTDAQSFSPPTYNPPRGENETDSLGESEPSIELEVKAPHFLKTGEVNRGHIYVRIPDKLMDSWNVTNASELNVSTKQNASLQNVSFEDTDGGVLLTADTHYSSGQVVISPESAATGGGAQPFSVLGFEIPVSPLTLGGGLVVLLAAGGAVYYYWRQNREMAVQYVE